MTAKVIVLLNLVGNQLCITEKVFYGRIMFGRTVWQGVHVQQITILKKSTLLDYTLLDHLLGFDLSNCFRLTASASMEVLF